MPSPERFVFFLLACGWGLLSFPGLTAGLRYTDEISPVLYHVTEGNWDKAEDAVRDIAGKKKKTQDRLVWQLEQSLIEYWSGSFARSSASFADAGKMMELYEDRGYGANLRGKLSKFASLLTNDSAMPYVGTDSDKIFLNAYLALSEIHLASKQFTSEVVKKMRQSKLELQQAVRQIPEDKLNEIMDGPRWQLERMIYRRRLAVKNFEKRQKTLEEMAGEGGVQKPSSFFEDREVQQSLLQGGFSETERLPTLEEVHQNSSKYDLSEWNSTFREFANKDYRLYKEIFQQTFSQYNLPSDSSPVSETLQNFFLLLERTMVARGAVVRVSNIFASHSDQEKQSLFRLTPMEAIRRAGELVGQQVERQSLATLQGEAEELKGYMQKEHLKAYSMFANPVALYLQGLYFMTRYRAGFENEYDTAKKAFFEARCLLQANPYFHDKASAVSLIDKDLVWLLGHPPKGGYNQTLPPEGTTVYVLFETGMIAKKDSRRITLPLPGLNTSIFFALPVLRPEPLPVKHIDILDEKDDKTAIGSTRLLADYDILAMQELRSRRQVLLYTAFARAALKGVIVNQASRHHELAGLVAGLYSIATNEADTRSWTSLPRQVQLARFQLEDLNGDDFYLSVPELGLKKRISFAALKGSQMQHILIHVRATMRGELVVLDPMYLVSNKEEL